MNVITDITHLTCNVCSFLISVVKNLLVVVHPDFCEANLVACDDIYAVWEGMGTSSAEYMADHRTGNDLQATPTHPYLQKQK